MIERFVERITGHGATVMRTDPAGVPAAIAAALADRATPTESAKVVVPPGLPARWLTEADVNVMVDGGKERPEPPLSAERLGRAAAVVTGAALAVADTGAIMLDGSSDQGRRELSLIPGLHVCVVRGDQIVARMTDADARANTVGRQTWVSGPEATEGGSHPRILRVILVSPSQSATGRSGS